MESVAVVITYRFELEKRRPCWQKPRPATKGLLDYPVIVRLLYGEGIRKTPDHFWFGRSSPAIFLTSGVLPSA